MQQDIENIILLSADALRADHLSCYGYHRNTSPRIDLLSENSIRFENAYSASSHTREAIPSLLTGNYPDVAIDSDYRLAKNTIASTLSEGGFKTAGFHSNPYISRAYGFDQGFDVFDDDLYLGQNKLIALAQRALDKLRNRHYARAEEINKRSLKWIDSIDGPFFLWNHYMDTHGPYEPPKDYATEYTETRISDRDCQSLYRRAIKKPESINDEEHQLLVDLYDGEIRYNDEQIGVFLSELKKRDLLDKSLIIVTADHGEGFGEHGYYEHPRYLHKELTHVPLLIRAPNGENRNVEKPVSITDISSTIRKLVDRSLTDNSEKSLFDTNDGENNVFMQARGEDENEHLRRYAAKTCDDVCYCVRDSETGKLRFTKMTNKELQADLKEHVEQRIKDENQNCGGADEEVNKEIEQRLSALGYKE